MDLKCLSDGSLHERNLQCAREEREVLARMLHQLRETEKRRLFAKYKCSSLFDYAVRFLKYSGDQAHRRIQAMRLLKELPEVESKISSGALTLTNLALAQKLFVKHKNSGKTMAPKQKIEVLAKLENQTTREAEKIVFAIEPEMKPKRNALDFNSIEDEALREKLLHLRSLVAHTDPNISLGNLLHKLCDQEIAKRTSVGEPKVNLKKWASGTAEVSSALGAPKVMAKAELRRRIWRRDQAKCINCGSTHALQVEHRMPKSVGGPDTLENLCLLCRTCNQRRAIEYYGLSKMQRYLKSPECSYGDPPSALSEARSTLNPLIPDRRPSGITRKSNSRIRESRSRYSSHASC